MDHNLLSRKLKKTFVYILNMYYFDLSGNPVRSETSQLGKLDEKKFLERGTFGSATDETSCQRRRKNAELKTLFQSINMSNTFYIIQLASLIGKYIRSVQTSHEYDKIFKTIEDRISIFVVEFRKYLKFYTFLLRNRGWVLYRNEEDGGRSFLQ